MDYSELDGYLFEGVSVIKDIHTFDYLPKEENICLNIAYGIDENFILGAAVSINSILQNNRKLPFVFHIFVDNIPEVEKSKFEELAKINNTTIKLYHINCDALKDFPKTRNWTYATYFRFIIADYFSGKLTKLLYLDADIVCTGSISELISLNLDDKIVAVVNENHADWWKKRSELLNIPQLKNGYFNAGFLLINIPFWNKEQISKRAISLLRDPEVAGNITHLDQDILNMLLWDSKINISERYNTRYSINYELKKDFSSVVNDNVVFIHYIGPTKPWHSWGQYEDTTPFLKAKNTSPWKDTPLLEANSRYQVRYSAKHKINKGEFLRGFIDYIRYFLSKNS